MINLHSQRVIPMSKINKYNYINYKVYSVIKTDEKYGFRIKLDYEDGSDCIIQKGAFDTITEASEERDNTVI